MNLKKLVNNEIDLPLSSGVYLVTVQTIEQNFVEKIIIK
ncbi:MAG: T9SS type A sorting domain-containing protein [Flavobacteriaceae bacterium]